MKEDIYLGMFYEFVLKRNVIFALSNFRGGQKRVGMFKVFSLKRNVIFGLIDF